MLRSLLVMSVFLAGVYIGILIMVARKNNDLVTGLRRIFVPYSAIITIITVAGVLFISNFNEFASPQPVKSWGQLQGIIVGNGAIERLVQFGAFLGVVVLLSFLVLVPLSNWNQVKFFGFEATRILLAEKAKDELESNRELDFKLLWAVAAFADPNEYQKTSKTWQTYIEDKNLDMTWVLQDVGMFISQAYVTSSLNIPVRCDVLKPNDFSPGPGKVQNLPQWMIRTLDQSMASGEPSIWNDESNSMICVPVYLGALTNEDPSLKSATPPDYLIVVETYKKQFDLTDVAFVQGMVNVSIHVAALVQAEYNINLSKTEIV